MSVTDPPRPPPETPEVTPDARDKEIQTMLEKLWEKKQTIQEEMTKINSVFHLMKTIQLISLTTTIQDPEFPDDRQKTIEVVKFYQPKDVDKRPMSDQRRTEIFDRSKVDYDGMFPT